MTRVRHLVLVRHGQTQSNADSRMQGQLDTDLSDLGRSQAVTTAEILSTRKPLAIYASHLRRAWDTAEELAKRSGLTVNRQENLQETALGEWQGMTHHEVDAAYPGQREIWRDSPRWAPPGGESRIDVADRSVPVVKHVVDNEPEWGVDGSERPVVLVAHGGVICALTAALLDLPVDSWPVFRVMGNASWTQLSAHGDARFSELRWRLDVWNASAQVSNDVL
ncbi:MAG: histidine phosphatase family protein [Mycobacteriaceae bacterium]